MENSKGTDINVGGIEENIEELKRLLYRNELSQYGKRKLINYYEQKEKDYKRVLKENEYMHNELNKQQTTINKYAKENEEVKIKNNVIKRESEAYAEHMIRLDNELNLEKEKSKYEWIRQNCLSQELVNKLYIPIQKVKDKIRKNEEIIDISNDGDLIHELLQKNKVYEELLESEE